MSTPEPLSAASIEKFERVPIMQRSSIMSPLVGVTLPTVLYIIGDVMKIVSVPLAK